MRYKWGRVRIFGATLLLGFAACADLQQAAGGGDSTGGDEAGSASASPTGGEGTTAASAADAGSTASTPGSSGSSDDGGSDSGDTGPAPSQCWDDDPAAWSVEPLDTTLLDDGVLQDAALDGDGLRLVYAAGPIQAPSWFIAERASLDEPFAGAAPIAPWATTAPGLFGMRFAAEDQLTMILAEQVQRSRRMQRDWLVPEPATFDGALVAVPEPTIWFDDGLRIAFDLVHGPPIEGQATPIPYLATRDDLLQPFGGVERIRIADWGDDVPVLCTVPSRDGEHLLLGGAHPVVWTAPTSELVGSLDIWYARRGDDGDWVDPVRINAGNQRTREACPTSVTVDGCTMVVRWWSPQDTDVAFAIVSR
ncbi:MAG: hypothetical protein AAF721_23280 [Myxococcota bacterium]